MKKLINTLSVLVLSTGVVSGAMAADNERQSHHSIGASINSFGPGLFYTYDINDSLNFRGSLHGLSVDEVDVKLSNIDYEGDMKSSAAALLLDWYPMAQSSGWKNKLFLSGGAMAVNTKFRGDAETKLGDSITVGGATINSGDLDGLNVKIDNQQITPYLGIGWGNKKDTKSGFSFIGEIGLIYLNDVDVTLTKNDPNNFLTTANLQAESEDIVDDLEGVSAFASFGVSYHF